MIDVTLQDVGPCKKQLNIRVPKEDVQSKLEEAYDQLRHSAQVDGFRKSHVPRRLLERRFGEQVVEDLKQGLMAEASSEAIEKEGLHVLGEPSFESAEFKPDEDFTFEVTVEVRPEFDIQDYKDLAITRPSVEASEEEVEEGIAHLLRSRATWKPVEDAEVQEDDHLRSDWRIEVDGETASSDEDSTIPVGPGVFASLGVEDFPAQVKGAKAGETRTLEVVLPEDEPNEKFRGKKGVLHLDIKAVQRAEVPELNEELAREFDFDSVEELREEARRQMRARKEREARQAMEDAIGDRLLEKVAFDLPEGLVKRQARQYMQRQAHGLRMRGLPEEEVRKHLGALRAASEEAAVRNFKLYFILEQIAEKEKIYVTENEVETMIASLAHRHQTTAGKLRQQLEQEDSLSSLRHEMRQDKTMQFLLDGAKIEEAKV